MENSINVLIFVESRYKVNRKRIRSAVGSTLSKEGVKSPVEVSVAVVGDRKMRELSLKYKGEDKTRNILTFSLSDGASSRPPTDKLRLGDIVISYPKVIEEAARDGMLVGGKIAHVVVLGL